MIIISNTNIYFSDEATVHLSEKVSELNVRMYGKMSTNTSLDPHMERK